MLNYGRRAPIKQMYGLQHIMMCFIHILYDDSIPILRSLPAICEVPLKASKLELVVRLLQGGWIVGAATPVRSGDDPKSFSASMRLPLSYFAALLSSNAIFLKGVNEILHGQRDHYYRCLLQLPAAALLSVLSEAEGKPDAWFRAHLMADEADDEALGAASTGSASALVPASLADGADGVLAVDVAAGRWKRKLVSIGQDSEKLKVYFDNASHQSGIQRGWVSCPEHGCERYLFVSGTQSRFCSEMYCWHLRRHQFATKELHMECRPADDEIAAIETIIIMSDF